MVGATPADQSRRRAGHQKTGDGRGFGNPGDEGAVTGALRTATGTATIPIEISLIRILPSPAGGRADYNTLRLQKRNEMYVFFHATDSGGVGRVDTVRRGWYRRAGRLQWPIYKDTCCRPSAQKRLPAANRPSFTARACPSEASVSSRSCTLSARALERAGQFGGDGGLSVGLEGRTDRPTPPRASRCNSAEGRSATGPPRVRFPATPRPPGYEGASFARAGSIPLRGRAEAAHLAGLPSDIVKPFSGSPSLSRKRAQKSVAPPPLITAQRTVLAPFRSVRRLEMPSSMTVWRSP